MTLTETSRVFRKGVVYTAISAVLYYLVILIIFPLTKDAFLSLFPPKDPPTPIYGMLQPLEFKEQSIKNVEQPLIKLDTKTGRLPDDLPKKLTVYRIAKPIPSFEKGKNAIETAQRLGYTEENLVTSLKEDIYEWNNLESGAKLKINTNTKEIDLEMPLRGKTEMFPRGELTQTKAITLAKQLLSDTRRNDDLYLEGTQKVTLGHYEGANVENADNQYDAQLARVDFFRSIEDYPILGPDPKVGLVNVIVRNYGDKDIQNHYNYPKLETHIWEIQTQSNATYGIIPVTTAWKFVKENKAILANISPTNGSSFRKVDPITVDEIFINNIYIAYYDNETYQEYLQPIYVFEGKYTTGGTQGGNITYYFPAVVPEWIKTAE